MIDFEKDADALAIADEELHGLSALAKRAKVLQKEVEDLEAVTKERKDQLRKLTEQAIPEALAETGMRGFVMDDGSKVELKDFYSASISAARKAEAFQWLREHGMDDIIKNTVSVRFGRGEDELCSRLLGLLAMQGYPAEQAEKIEPMTLKAWVKEQVERGNEFPTELFGAYIGQKAIIKS
jgi:hypothetical protein|tara:strand:+ start:484 stop:1026 length:543 start_codon:yes stop_codon:yes gene_type:complete